MPPREVELHTAPKMNSPSKVSSCLLYTSEARRHAADLRSLTGREPVLLTGRELHWRELAAVSRQWEYRRLEALYRIRQEESPVIVTTADALALRCIPPQAVSYTHLWSS